MKTVHRLLPAMAGLLLAACGPFGSTAATPTPTPPKATPTPTPIPTADPLALASLFEGTYTGTWQNLTFSTTGPIKVESKLDRTARTLTVTVTVGGNVFGAAAPPPETYTFKLDGTALSFSGHSATFGDLTVTITPPAVSVKGVNVPSPNVSTFEAHGIVTDPRTINIDYTIGLRSGQQAMGKASLTKS